MQRYVCTAVAVFAMLLGFFHDAMGNALSDEISTYLSKNGVSLSGECSSPCRTDTSPDLVIDKLQFFTTDGHEKHDESSVLVPGRTYEIRNYPYAKKGSVVDGMDKSKDTVETDVYYKIGPDGEWHFLGRNYTRATTMKDGHKEKEVLLLVFSDNVPILMNNIKIYDFFKKTISKGKSGL